MLNPLKIYPAKQLKSLPPVDWLVENLIPKGSLTTLFGASGLGKSFIALDMCLCVASGRPWLGKFHTAKGHALYLPFEGLAGLGQRIAAWEKYHGIPDTPEAFWYAKDFETIQHHDPVLRLLEGIKEQLPEPPKLVIIDTLSRAMMGAEENSAKDANLAMSNLDKLRASTGTAIMLIHHTTKNTDYERGSTAIRAACDTMLLLKKDDDALILKVDKQRDADPGKPFRLFMNPVDDSVVLSMHSSKGEGELGREAEDVLDAYWSIRQGDEPISYSAWKSQCEDLNISESTFKRRLKELVTTGRFVRTGTPARPYYMPADEATE